MKIDKSLEEVWRWKEAVYEGTRHMTGKQRIQYFNDRAATIKKKYHLRLKTVQGHPRYPLETNSGN